MKTLSLRVARAIPWLGLLVMGLAVTLGILSGGAMAAIGIAGALLLFLAVWWTDGRWPGLHREITLFCGGILIIITLLNLQAAWPAVAWHQTFQLATILLPLCLLSSVRVQALVAQPVFFKIWPWLFGFGLTVLGLELLLGNPLQAYFRGEVVATKANRGISYALLLIWPALALLVSSGMRLRAILLALLLVPILILTVSRASQLAVMLAVPVMLLAQFLPRLTTWLLGAMAVMVSGWSFAAQAVFAEHPDWVAQLPDSWRARMEIWDFMSYHILERPWFGWGLGSSWHLQPVSPHAHLYAITTSVAGHPHNAFTQLWVELGLPGLLLGIVLALGSLRIILRLSRELVPFALAAWIVAFVFCMVAYDFWTDSLLATFALTGCAFGLVQNKNKAAGRLQQMFAALKSLPNWRFWRRAQGQN